MPYYASPRAAGTHSTHVLHSHSMLAIFLLYNMKYKASIEQQKQEAETERKRMEVDVRREDTHLRTNTAAHDTVIKTETQKEIEQMKAQLALVLAQMNMTDLKEAEAEAVERGI